MRGIQYAAASRFYHPRSGILDHPLSRMMTPGEYGAFVFIKRDFAISRRDAPEFCL
jgi:hypothetical protein